MSDQDLLPPHARRCCLDPVTMPWGTDARLMTTGDDWVPAASLASEGDGLSTRRSEVFCRAISPLGRSTSCGR